MSDTQLMMVLSCRSITLLITILYICTDTHCLASAVCTDEHDFEICLTAKYHILPHYVIVNNPLVGNCTIKLKPGAQEMYTKPNSVTSMTWGVETMHLKQLVMWPPNWLSTDTKIARFSYWTTTGLEWTTIAHNFSEKMNQTRLVCKIQVLYETYLVKSDPFVVQSLRETRLRLTRPEVGCMEVTCASFGRHQYWTFLYRGRLWSWKMTAIGVVAGSSPDFMVITDPVAIPHELIEDEIIAKIRLVVRPGKISKLGIEEITCSSRDNVTAYKIPTNTPKHILDWNGMRLIRYENLLNGKYTVVKFTVKHPILPSTNASKSYLPNRENIVMVFIKQPGVSLALGAIVCFFVVLIPWFAIKRNIRNKRHDNLQIKSAESQFDTPACVLRLSKIALHDEDLYKKLSMGQEESMIRITPSTFFSPSHRHQRRVTFVESEHSPKPTQSSRVDAFG